ncbi:MAG: tRNA uridine-5-carboxymethylaminomethyl(34) synthesis GTPase MnmE [Candidatus Eisenbacteria bacterium]|nr:tRNA uridine-5-carboxymethylaminomethyl(34) synthesis GTPase MnmE [Candidatus Eisenbacteria bacterium]
MRRLQGDTIAAISTALGPGAIAIVRLSGDEAIEIGDRVFRGRLSLGLCQSHTVHLGRIVDRGGRVVDEVLATVLCSPHTYTTEHMLEFACHGGAVPAREVLSACLAAGARQAGPGEFTERAFMNGRIDLIQAEAVADLVSARTRRGLELALGQLEGALSSRVGELREALVDMRAAVEAAIDFPDEVDARETRVEVARRSAMARLLAEELLSNCDLGVAVRDGVAVAIVGKPNVGKSSLMNAMLARERSIVTEAPGTTRDAIEECLNIDGVAFRLIDTAGWRTSDDIAERAGVRRAREAASGADLCLLVVDVSRAIQDEDRAVASALPAERVLIVGNKSDLGQVVTRRELASLVAGPGRQDLGPGRLGVALPRRDPSMSDSEGNASGPTLCESADGRRDRTSVVSAKRGNGLVDLKASMVRAALGDSTSAGAEVSNVRHIHGLRSVLSSLDRLDAAAGSAPLEILGTELAEATDALGELSGETTPEQVIERIFARFCIGK